MDHLHFSVDLNVQDDVWVAKVTEYPLLSAHGNSWEKALSELKTVVAAILKDE